MKPRLLFLLMVPLAIRAQVLTMEDAVERALASSAELASVRAVLNATPFQQQAARALEAPEIRMSFTNLSIDPELADSRNIAALRWTPPRPHEQSLKSRLVETKAKQSAADVRLTESRLIAKVRQLYRRAALTAERTRLAAEAVSLHRRVLEVTEKQIAQGLKEAPEADLAALALADAEAANASKASQERLERFRLEQAVDPTGNTKNFTLEPVPAALPVVVREAVAIKAVETRQELRHAEAVCDQYRSEFALVRNQRYPWISGIQVTRRFGNTGSDRAPWGLQIGVDLPVFRSQPKAEAGIAQANAERCALQQNALRQQIVKDAGETAMRLETTVAELKRLEQLTIGPADRLLESARKALDAGRADRIDVLLAEVRSLAMRDRLLDKRLELADIEMEFDIATGQ